MSEIKEINEILSGMEVSEENGHKMFRFKQIGWPPRSMEIIEGNQPLSEEKLTQAITEELHAEHPKIRDEITKNGGIVSVSSEDEEDFVFDSPQFTITNKRFNVSYEIHFKEYDMTYYGRHPRDTVNDRFTVSAEELKDRIIKQAAENNGSIILTDGEKEICIKKESREYINTSKEDYISVSCDGVISLIDIGQENAASKMNSIVSDLVIRQSIGENISESIKDGYDCTSIWPGAYRYPSGMIKISHPAVNIDGRQEEYPAISMDLTLMDTSKGLVVKLEKCLAGRALYSDESNDKRLLIEGMTSQEFLQKLNNEYEQQPSEKALDFRDMANLTISQITDKTIENLTPEKADEIIRETETKNIAEKNEDRELQ